MGSGVIWEISVLPSQFCCESTIVLKNGLYKVNKIENYESIFI